ncbi:MAG TPA: hypothetical protein O0W90_02300 [Methanocorpusculum sp.]|nr:hypothetical protein [Methanocorpusculum sp.]
MGIGIFPKVREGIDESEMNWNELFYVCLQKPLWLITAGIIFIGLVVFFIFTGKLADFIDAAVLFLWAIGFAYLPIAMPASLIYATVKKYSAKRAKQN